MLKEYRKRNQDERSKQIECPKCKAIPKHSCFNPVTFWSTDHAHAMRIRTIGEEPIR